MFLESLQNSQQSKRTWQTIALFGIACFSLLTFLLGKAFFVYADAQLTVSLDCTEPLIGSTSTCTATITNADASTLYGLSLEAQVEGTLADGAASGAVTFDSTTYPVGTVSNDSGTQTTTGTWTDISDLAAGEELEFEFTYQTGTDGGWDVSDTAAVSLTATVDASPALNGNTTYSTQATDSTTVRAVLVEVEYDQSTGRSQVTGPNNHFDAVITVTNNSVDSTTINSVTASFPDGIRFYSGDLEEPEGTATDACDLAPASSTTQGDSSVDVVWDTSALPNSGVFVASATTTITCDVFVDYDYDADGSVVEHGTTFSLDVDTDYSYPSSSPTVNENYTVSDNVFAVFMAINKTIGQEDFGTSSNNLVDYTITHSASDYYSFSNVEITDTLSGGHFLCTGANTGYDTTTGTADGTDTVTGCTTAASRTPDSVTENSPSTGETEIVFDLGLVEANGESTTTFETLVNTTDGNGNTLVAGDVLTNDVTVAFDYTDQEGATNDGSGSRSYQTELPSEMPTVAKTVCLGDIVAGCTAAQNFTNGTLYAAQGDTVTFRLEFDGTSTISMDDILVTDWLPDGVTYNSTVVSPGGDCVNSGTFTNGDETTTNTGSAFGMNYLQWDLGDPSSSAAWCAHVEVEVDSDTVIGSTQNNLMKVAGTNSTAASYSLRDSANLVVGEPELTVALSDATDTDGGNPEAGDTLEWTATIENTGNTDATNVRLRNYIPQGLRGTNPTTLSYTVSYTDADENTTAYTQGTEYTISWDGVNYYLDFDLSAGTDGDTAIEAGGVVTVTYRTHVNTNVGMGATLTNIASARYDASGATITATQDTADTHTDDGALEVPDADFTTSASTSRIRVGDQVTFYTDFTVPAGMAIFNMRLDSISLRDGYTRVSEAISVTSGSCSAPTPNGNWESLNSGISNRETFRWNFDSSADDINNTANGTDCVVRAALTLIYDGIEDDGTSWEYWNETGALDSQVVETSSSLFHGGLSCTSCQTMTTSEETSVEVDVDQPEIIALKSHSGSNVYSPGQTISYTVTLENDGAHNAYDMVVVDTLPTGLSCTSIDSVQIETATNTYSTVSPANYSATCSGTTMQLDFSNTGSSNVEPFRPAAARDQMTINYTVTVDDDVAAGVDFENTVDVDWRSMNAADSTGERYYEETAFAAQEIYPLDVDTDSVSIELPSITKSSDAGAEVGIGEEVTVTATVTVPAESALYSPVIVDTIDEDGWRYVSGSGSATLVSGDLDGTDTITFADSGTSTPDGEDIYVTDSDDDDEANITINLGHIDNSDTSSSEGDEDAVFTVTFDIAYAGLESDQATWLLWPYDDADYPLTVSDSLDLAWDSAASGGQEVDADITSETVSFDVVQSLLSADKTIESPSGSGTYVDGPIAMPDDATSSYQIIVENTGNGTAHEVVIYDDYDAAAYGNPTITDVYLDADGNGTFETELLVAVDYTIDTGSDPMTITFATLAANDAVRIRYTLDATNTAVAGSTSTNTVDVDWTSAAGSVDYARDYDDSSQETAQHTADEDSVSLNVGSPSFTTTVSNANPTIGDEITYTTTLTIPANTTVFSATIASNLPDGVTYLSHTTSEEIGTVTVDSVESAGERLVEWDLGDVPSSTYSELEFTVTVRVDDTFEGGSQLDGLSADIDGDAQDTVTTDFEFSYTVGDEEEQTTSTTSTDVTLVEPQLTTTKTTDVDGEQSLDDTIGYTVVIENTGLSTAYEVAFTDDLASDMLDEFTLTSATSSVSGTLTLDTDYTFPSVENGPQVLFVNGIAVGETITLVYTADVASSAAAGTTLTNTADVDWYSLGEGSTDPRSYTDEESFEGDTDTAAISSETPTVSMTQSGTTGTIGAEITYTLTVDTNGLTVYNAEFGGLLADGMDLVSTSETTGSVTEGVDSGVNNRDLVTWVLGDLNTGAGSESLDITARISNTYDSGTELDGLSVGIDGDAADTLDFPGFFTWETADSGGDELTIAPSPTAITVQEPRISTTKTTITSNGIQAGDTISYQAAFTNIGEASAYSVVLEDNLASGNLENLVVSSVTSSVNGTLTESTHYTVDTNSDPVSVDFATSYEMAVGETLTVAYTADALDSLNLAEEIDNTADVDWASLDTATATNPRQYNDTEIYLGDTSTADNAVASAMVTKTSAVSQATIGEEFTYTITTTIGDDTTVYDVEIADTLPDGVTYVSHSISEEVGTVTVAEESAGETAISWTIDSVTNPETSTLTLSITVRLDDMLSDASELEVDDVIENTASTAWALTDGGELSTVQDSAAVTVVEPSLALSKTYTNVTDPSATPEAGDVLEYSVELTNSGDAAAYDVVISDDYSASLDYVADSASVTAFDSGAVLTLSDISVAANDSTTVTYRMTVNGGVLNGATVSNTAELTAYSTVNGSSEYERGYTGGNDTAEFSVEAGYLNIDKATTEDDFIVQVGDTVEYQVVVDNDGSASVYNVDVIDTLPTGFSYVENSATVQLGLSDAVAAEPTQDEQTLTWEVTELEASEQLVITYSVLVGELTSGEYTNTATVEAEDGAGTAIPADGSNGESEDENTDDSDSVTMTLTTLDYDVTKTLTMPESGEVEVGTSVEYTITIENTGDTTLNALAVSDAYDSDALQLVNNGTYPQMALGDADLAYAEPDSNASGLFSYTDITETIGDIEAGETVTLLVRFTSLSAATAVENTVTVSNVTDEYGYSGDSETSENTTLTITDPAEEDDITDDTTDDATDDSTEDSVDDINTTDDVEEEVPTVADDEFGVVKTANPRSGTVLIPDGLIADRDGDIITYTITAQNNTDEDVTGITVTDPIPEGVNFIPGSITFNGNSVTDAADDDLADVNETTEGAVTWVLNRLRAGKQRTMTFKVQVAELQDGVPDIVNIAEVTSNEKAFDTSNDVVHPVDPFTITKEAEDVNGGAVEVGDELLYTIEVENIGHVPTTGTEVIDDLPDGLTYVPGSIEGTGAQDSEAPRLVWFIGTMEVGATETMTFRARVNETANADDEIVNIAVVRADQSNDKASDNPNTSIEDDGTAVIIGERLATTGMPVSTLLPILLVLLGLSVLGYTQYADKRA